MPKPTRPRGTGAPARKQPPAAAQARGPAMRVDFTDADYLRLIGQRLRARRLAAKLSPSELARAVRARGKKLSDDTVANYENGMSNMKLVSLRDIAGVLGIQIVELLDDSAAFDVASGRLRSPERDALAEIARRLPASKLRLVVQYAQSLDSPALPRKVA